MKSLDALRVDRPQPGAKLIYLRLLAGLGLVWPWTLHAQNPPLNAQVLEKENVVESEKLHAAWVPAAPIQALDLYEQVRTGALSRGLVRLLDTTTARLDENSQVAILPAAVTQRKAALNLRKGQIYVRDREQTGDLEVVTPGGTVRPNGTEFQVTVDGGGKASVNAFDGTVDLINGQGTATLAPGEEGFLEAGRKPYKTSAIYARNEIIQWALYYPAVLDPAELGLSAQTAPGIARSLEAYEAGDLLGALRLWPAGDRPRSAGEALFRAAVLLSVGRVDQATSAMHGVPKGSAGRIALEEMIAAVKFEKYDAPAASTAGEWMALSYLRQSTGELDAALAAAREATRLAPHFGYAWERVAELEFSFGHTRASLEALDHSLAESPRNAQGHSLRGFLLSAQNNIGRARESFETAISLDGALGNAWLGRGLTFIRQGKPGPGNRDLQAAAGLEPSRSLLHSYLGKAFSQVGEAANARAEFARAKQIDPKDPTPFLYNAIEDKQENRYNDAVRELETSILLNDNRRVFRSQFLLDQDKSVRGVNLAAIYRNDGMIEQSVREAVQAVNDDYSSASAHLFLSESYDALRDPRRIQLRYETAWFDELLLSNLLSPVGGGPLSQFVSQQEYSKLFEADGLGISSTFDYFSRGAVQETASQFGTFGNFSYALDTQYFYDRGYRDNNTLSDLESYFTMKLQLGPQDTLFFKTKYEDQRSGQLLNSYDPRDAALTEADRTLHFRESQEPALLLLGLHHEWAPGIHTLLLGGRLANSQLQTASQPEQLLLQRDVALSPQALALDSGAVIPSFRQIRDVLRPLLGRGPVTGIFSLPLDYDYGARFETYTGEFQQIVETGPMTLIAGARYQKGRFTTRDLLTSEDPFLTEITGDPAADEDFAVPFERFSLYLYDIWRVAPWLSLTGGVTWDRLRYPQDFRSAPVNDRDDRLEHVSPKAGFIFRPARNTVFRGVYAEAISGASFDESISLEPVEVAGFNQAFRDLIPEDILGELAGSVFRIWGLSLEQKLPTSTYLGVEANLLQQRVSPVSGDFELLESPDDFTFFSAFPASIRERVTYREETLSANINQLLGRDLSIGARFQYTGSSFHQDYPGIPTTLAPGAQNRQRSELYTTSLFALYNHPSGFFARVEANWYVQSNAGFAATLTQNPEIGADFWQINALAGWRFYRNQCEISAGVLNIGGRDYRLEPLNPYFELPRDREFVVHCRFAF